MALNSEESMIDKISEYLSQQVSEFELLKSMYPKHNEILLTDRKVLDQIEDFIHRKSEHIPSHLDFVINLYIKGLKLEVCINLPSFYPSEEPDICVRCNQLNRQQETFLNNELSNYIKNNHTGEVCLYTAVSWLQDNAELFINDTSKINTVQKDEETCTIEDKFVRMWIYSHHIYNKRKREDIMKLAKQLRLTGFCLPGKPGIICIEGPSRDCLEWWKDIKSLTWKKIVVKKTEIFDVNEQEKEQKFGKFEEIGFYSTNNDHHRDMKAFAKCMKEHGLTQAANECLGLDV